MLYRRHPDLASHRHTIMSAKLPTRAMIQVAEKTHERVRREALKRQLPVYAVATLLLDHALDSLKAGEVKLTGPTIETP